ncbi:hypothetical protein K3G63_06650 [Hymenobacter sp. HSC-4F20]|uniref:hypothetical protein n=1 Tax=Hymenobacter sp. HSC-4F20 TaxID=2864135 RepID=UPI001C73905D|nr:hypothetical protein [Hymenobacter sp. HSC-4F20]MBX0290110.1 hypothetical protein [Hymenobacter sp. HSC-4F20]
MSEKNRGLGHMTIGGQKRPFQVNGIRQANAFCETLNIELDDYWQKMTQIASNGVLSNMVLLSAFVYSSLYAGARKERLEIDFDYEDVVDWIEDADESEAPEIGKPLQLWSELITKAAEEAETSQPDSQKPKKA